MSELRDALDRLRGHVRRREYRRAPIDRGIGSPYATVRDFLDYWGQSMNQARTPDLETMLGHWRERHGAEPVSEAIAVLAAETETGDRPPYGGNARAGV